MWDVVVHQNIVENILKPVAIIIDLYPQGDCSDAIVRISAKIIKIEVNVAKLLSIISFCSIIYSVLSTKC